MDNLSKFSEMLDSLMFEREITLAQLAKEIGIDATTMEDDRVFYYGQS